MRARSVRGVTYLVSARVTAARALDLLYVRSLFRPADFGGNRYPWEVTRRLAAAGHAVRVVTPRPGGPLPGTTAAALIPYPVSRRTPLETFGTNAVFSRLAVEREIRRRRPDLIVLSSYEVAFGHFALARPRLPSVYIYHSSFTSDSVQAFRRKAGPLGGALQRFVRGVEATTYRGADAIVAVSPFSRQEVEARLGRPDPKVHVIPTGVDVERFRPGDRAAARAGLGLPTDARILIVSGRLVPVKRYDRAIEALALLKRDDPRYRLLVVGRGPEEPALRALAADRALGDAVRFEGFRDGDELVARLVAADVQLCTSDFENWSLALLEGLAAGLPVVGVPRGGIPHLLRTVDPRLVADAATPEAVAARVRECLAAERHAALAAAARATVIERYSWEHVLGQLVALFDAVARR